MKYLVLKNAELTSADMDNIIATVPSGSTVLVVDRDKCDAKYIEAYAAVGFAVLSSDNL